MAELSLAILSRMQEDLRLGPTHISLMAAILKLCAEQAGDGLIIEVTGRLLRKVAHIGGKGAYYRYLRDLVRLEYIRYTPFFEHKRVGRIEVLLGEKPENK